MQVCTFLGTQRHLTYQQQHEYAVAAEDLGFDGWFRADHYGSTNREVPDISRAARPRPG